MSTEREYILNGNYQLLDALYKRLHFAESNLKSLHGVLEETVKSFDQIIAANLGVQAEKG